MDKKAGKGPALPGNPLAALGGLTELQGQISQFLVAAEELKGLAHQFDGIQSVVGRIDEARSVAAQVLEEFAAFEYDLVKQRLVVLRMQYHLMWGDYISPKTPDGRIQELLDREQQFRGEYDAIQALILLARGPDDGTT
jgi:hypothetical protein